MSAEEDGEDKASEDVEDRGASAMEESPATPPVASAVPDPQVYEDLERVCIELDTEGNGLIQTRKIF